MSLRKQQKNTQKELVELVNSRGNNNTCGECGASYPTWASCNLGLFLCGRCASYHKRVLGPEISTVQSLTLDKWTPSQIESLARIGNKRAKKKWNPKRVPFPYDDEDSASIEDYFRDKYINALFRDDRDSLSEYDERSDRHYSNYPATPSSSRSSIGGGRSRSGSVRDIPLLSHRKLTTYENSQYASQAVKIMSFGYTDRDSVLESLLLSNGNIDFALSILEKDAKINPNRTELPPELPKRPSTSQPSQVQAPTSQSEEWWNNSTGVAPTATGAAPAASVTSAPLSNNGQPQIYQYTDPVTGIVSYVDANGQQYLDPNNPQHQQMLYQQTNPQLVAQETNKQSILSLYNKPTSFATNVVVPAGQAPQSNGSDIKQQQLQQQPVPSSSSSISSTQTQQPQQFQSTVPSHQQQPQMFMQGQPQVQQQVPVQFTGFQQPQYTGFQQPQYTGFQQPYMGGNFTRQG